MRQKANRFWLGLTLAMFSSLLLWGSTGCTPGGEFSSLDQFQTCDELLGYLKERAKREARDSWNGSSSGGFRSAGAGGFGFPGAAPTAQERGDSNTQTAPGASKGSSNDSAGGGSAPRDYSRTNNQVTGVDEADIIKNDGKYLYVLNHSYFLIIKAWPAKELKLVGQYKMDAQPQEMFVHKDKVVIFTRASGSSKMFSSMSRRVYSQVTQVTVLDVADKTQPSLIRTIVTEGEYKSARRIGTMVRAVMYARMDGPRISYSYGGQYPTTPWQAEVMRDKQIQNHMEKIDQTKLADWLPRISNVQYAAGKESSRKEFVLSNCAAFYRPTVDSGRGIITVFSLEIDKPNTDLKHSSLVSNYAHTYGSGTALYVATHAHSHNNYTHIHKFDISKVGQPATYVASGSVMGGVLNQFAMDEYQGHLRVATTSREGFGTENNVFVLKQDGGKLRVVGSVRGLARGERIYSARFLQDRGYIVTFRQIDPLFTLDLSNPTSPRAVGELKIPGFSTYMHPLDRNHLLTIGVDGDDRGATGGVQLAIFDVTDFANPKQAHKYTLSNERFGGSSSTALYDHKAFNYFHARKVLAIPAQTSSHKPGSSGYFIGVQLLNIDIQKGISLRGQVGHGDLYNTDSKGEPNHYGSNGPQMRRSAFIEDYFYSISSLGMKVHHIDQLTTGAAQVLFPR